MALIEFDQVAFGYTDERLIASASAALQRREIVGLVGANGCGKTTLLNLILGKLSPESGQAQHARTARIAFVPQAPYTVTPHMGGGHSWFPNEDIGTERMGEAAG